LSLFRHLGVDSASSEDSNSVSNTKFKKTGAMAYGGVIDNSRNSLGFGRDHITTLRVDWTDILLCFETTAS